MKLNPAEYVIYIFGGVRATARALNKYPSTVSKWQNYTAQNGQRGYIPTAIQKDILEKAKELGLDVNAEDLIYGRVLK